MTGYECPPQGGLQVDGGSSNCFALPFPTRVALTRLVIRQTAGAPVAFTVDLFNHASVCSGDSTSDGDAPFTGPLHEDMYRVHPQLSSDTPGALAKFFDPQPLFFNQDPLTTTGQNRRIYIRINAQGTGAKEFALVLGCVPLNM